MDIPNPNSWSSRYVSSNERECVEILQALTAAMAKALQAGEYLAAAHFCDRACSGFSKMCEFISANQYAPMLYAYSYMLGEITLFGVGSNGAYASKAREMALAYFEDAYDFARDCAKPGRRTASRAGQDAEKIQNIVSAIRRGYSSNEIMRSYCPDFPRDILDNVKTL